MGQFQVAPGDVDRNFENGVKLIKEAKDKGCNVILLPEVWTTGFPFKKLKDLSKTTPSILEEIKKQSEDILICGTYIVDNPESDKVFNIFYALLNGKTIFSYKKTMLFGLTGEDKYFERGNIDQSCTFEAFGTTFGVSICYELRFPEFFRRTSFNGAIIHLHPSLWPENRLDHWLVLSRARAIENQFFLMTSNGVGISDKWELCGHSTIYDPWGEVENQIKKDEGLAVNTIDLRKVREIRQQLTSLLDSIEILKNVYFK